MVVMVKIILVIAVAFVLFHAFIGALFMYTTRYDYNQSIKACQEMVRLYPDDETITATARE